MTRGRDFYGEEIAELIEEACRALGRPREQLDIAVVETGSAGIFGLCKKKAHIRVRVKEEARTAPRPPGAAPPDEGEAAGRGRKKRPEKPERPAAQPEETAARPQKRAAASGAAPQGVVPAIAEAARAEAAESVSPPAPECLSFIEDRLGGILTRMGLPATVRVSYADGLILCGIGGEHEEYLAGQDGKILDNLQYLLRKMLGARLPDRVTLSLDAAGCRKRRLTRLRQQATELATQVLRDGKTRSIPGLNPAERQMVHLALQQAGEVRSRSVGTGLLKKVLIFKSGREEGEGDAAPGAGKRRSRAGAPRRD